MFGEGDIAFFDIALAMRARICAADTIQMTKRDLSEKGYVNTFNHVMAQCMMTTLFSERIADFVADVHERDRLPGLISGEFTPDQWADVDEGPVDNYVDMINNEWGQELGKRLRRQFDLSTDTHWTPDLLSNYLNAILFYHAWAFQIGFTPFRPEDELVVKFARKINAVRTDLGRLEAYY
jgi:hypothetical protein